MYLIDTKFETIFFNLGLIPGTINGVLRYVIFSKWLNSAQLKIYKNKGIYSVEHPKLSQMENFFMKNIEKTLFQKMVLLTAILHHKFSLGCSTE